MSLLLASVAFAITPDELADAELHAGWTIAACETDPRCEVDERELAEAFVIRAAAAAVLRGEVDHESAANAMLLAPEMVRDWSHVLPAIDPKRASPWVREWPPAATARPVPAETAEPERNRASSQPTRHVQERPVLSAGPLQVRFGLGGRYTRIPIDTPAWFFVQGDLEVRASVAESLGMVVRLDWEHANFGVPFGDGTTLDRVSGNGRRVDVGVGPRWVGSHFDASLYGGLVGTHSSLTLGSYRRSVNRDRTVFPASLGWGGTLGAVGELRLTRQIGVYGHTRLAVLKKAFAADYLGPRRDDAVFGAEGNSAEDLDSFATDALEGLVVGEVQIWVTEHFRAGLGVQVATQHGLEPRPEGSAPGNSDSEWTPRLTTAVSF